MDNSIATQTATGAAVRDYSYNNRGLLTSDGTGGTSVRNTTGNSLWYRGLVRDGTNGAYQLGTRTYDPTTGGFTTPDTYRVSTPSTDLSVGVDP